MVSHALLPPILPVTAACESGPWQASLARCYGLLSVTYSRRVSLRHPKNDPPFPKPSFLAVSTDLAPNSRKIAKWQYPERQRAGLRDHRGVAAGPAEASLLR